MDESGGAPRAVADHDQSGSGGLVGETVASTPATLVQLNPSSRIEAQFGNHKPDGDLAPDLALTLAAVLLASAEQVSERKLATFKVESRHDLTLLAVAMAFRGDDSGLTGDVFEWSLLLAVNAGDSAISQMMTDALLLNGVQVEQPQAVLVAAEPGRLVAFSPELPQGATLATGRRGRPPHVANLLRHATTRTWKADLVLGSGERWVSTSLKSNPKDLRRSLVLAAATPHPPRIGVTASRKPGITRDSETGAVLVHIPVHGKAMSLSKFVLTDVIAAFERHLELPETPLRQDGTGIGHQLHQWQDRTVDDVVTTLQVWSGERAQFRGYKVGHPQGTGASVPDANGALIAANPIVDEGLWDEDLGLFAHYDMGMRHRYGNFTLLD